MSSCPSCGCNSCPETVGTVNVTNNTISAASTLTVVVANTDPVAVNQRLITITVAAEGYWLLRIWFSEISTPSHFETQTPPSDPGISQFFKVTNALGVCQFTVKDDDPNVSGIWYPQVALVGRVIVGDGFSI